MDRNAYRDEDRMGQPDAYWRRRVLTLAAGLGLLGLLAWGFSGGGGKPAPAPSPVPVAELGTAVPGLPGQGTPSGTATQPGTVTPSGMATATGAAGTASPASARSGGAPVSASPSANRLRPGPRPRPSTAASPAAPPAWSGGRCPPGSVVLSLFTDRPSYGSGEYPRFDVYAVDTSAAGCAFDPHQTQVVVMSSGRIVWDSADCAHGGARATELARGVPVQDSVTWNRAITLPGCEVLAPYARPGSYLAQARTAIGASPARSFRLTG